MVCRRLRKKEEEDDEGRQCKSRGSNRKRHKSRERVGDRIGSAHYTALIIALKERWKKAGREAVNRLGSVRYGSVTQCFS